MLRRSNFERGLFVRATAVVVPLFLSSVAAAAPQYTISQFAVPTGVTGFSFTDMNDQGVVVGDFLSSPLSVITPFVSNGTTATLLNPLVTGEDASPHAINNGGVIVGYGTDQDFNVRGVYFGSGMTPTTVIVPSMTVDHTADGITNTGVISGSNGHAFTYANGTVTDLGILSGFSKSAGNAINASGQVAGRLIVNSNFSASVNDRGFIWDSTNGMVNLGLPEGETNARVDAVEGINDNGWVTGSWQRYVGSTPQNRRPFVYRNGVMEDIMPAIADGGFGFLDALDINNLGQIVGNGQSSTGQPLGFLWDNDVTYNLNDLLQDQNSGWVIYDSLLTNNSGQILVDGTFNGQSAFALLTPVPVPAAVWLFGSGLAGLFAMARRRRVH